MSALKSTQAERMLGLASHAGTELWSTPAGEPFMTITVDSHREHHRLGSRPARDWLARLHHADQGRPPSAQALQDALGVLRGQALWDGERHEAHVRHAAVSDTIYLDLADREWRAVEITPTDWQVISDPPVRFRRPRGMLALPEPQRGGSLSELRELLNLDGHGWVLVAGFIVGAMAPDGPYPLLAYAGEAGTAKTSAARLTRSTIDPNIAPLRSEPRDERDLLIAATNGRIVGIDNVSRIPPWLSDGLCRLATGGGLATRELFSDSEEIIFTTVRPTILTSIAEVTTRGDLADRAIAVTLQPIGEHERLTERELEARWAEIQPRVLGGLLDAASCALRRLDDVRLDRLPRMADHARWVTAAEPALGWDAGTYLGVFGEAREHAAQVTLDDSILTAPLLKVAETGFTGTATALLRRLEEDFDVDARHRDWPKTASGLSGKLRRLAPELRMVGVEIEFPTRSKACRELSVRKVTQESVTSVTASPSAPGNQISDDGAGDGDALGDGVTGIGKPHQQARSDSGDGGDGDWRSRSNDERREEPIVAALQARLGAKT